MQLTKQCLQCSAEFTSQDRNAKFCGRSCFHASLRTLSEIACAECRVQFRPVESKQRFCSLACRSKDRGRLLTNRVLIACQHCGHEFGQKPSLIGTSRFCSNQCKDAAKTAKGNVALTCKVCGTHFNRRKSRTGEFCSYACMGRAKESQVEITCRICKVVFKSIASHASFRVTCSRRCKRIDWTKTIRKYIGKRGPTIPEKRTRAALEALGVNFTPEHPVGGYIVDFYLPDHCIALEVDGVYWHSLPESKIRDAKKTAHLESLGITVVRITDTEINKSADPPGLVRSRLHVA